MNGFILLGKLWNEEKFKIKKKLNYFMSIFRLSYEQSVLDLSEGNLVAKYEFLDSLFFFLLSMNFLSPF